MEALNGTEGLLVASKIADSVWHYAFRYCKRIKKV